MLPLWLRRFYPARKRAKREPDVPAASQGPANPFLAHLLLKPVDFLALVTLGFGLILAAEAFGSLIGGPSVLWQTTLLIAGHVPVVRTLSGSMQLGRVSPVQPARRRASQRSRL
jgi:hypothetical protein